MRALLGMVAPRYALIPPASTITLNKIKVKTPETRREEMRKTPCFLKNALNPSLLVTSSYTTITPGKTTEEGLDKTAKRNDKVTRPK